MKIFLVQTGQTTWAADSRITSAAGAPLTDAGVETAHIIAAQLAEAGIKSIHACPGEGEQQTAQLLAKQLRIKAQMDAELADLDFGLWQGLTVEEIKRRQPKLYKQWADDPTIICPPSGETIGHAQLRLRQRLKTSAKKPKNMPAAVVLGPVATGLLRCLLAGADLEQLWQHVDASFTWTDFQVNPEQL